MSDDKAIMLTIGAVLISLMINLSVGFWHQRQLDFDINKMKLEKGICLEEEHVRR